MILGVVGDWMDLRQQGDSGGDLDCVSMTLFRILRPSSLFFPSLLPLLPSPSISLTYLVVF